MPPMSPSPSRDTIVSRSGGGGGRSSRSASSSSSAPWTLELNAKRVKKAETFMNKEYYKEYVENAIAFNRKLNEERKMRIPYIDGQTGVAQRHYNCLRSRRERMPPRKHGQVVCYPQKEWKKRRFQYLRFFLQPAVRRFDPDAEMHSQIENPSLGGGAPGGPQGAAEDPGQAGGAGGPGGAGGKDGSKEVIYYIVQFRYATE